jgi:hypothetical protein
MLNHSIQLTGTQEFSADVVIPDGLSQCSEFSQRITHQKPPAPLFSPSRANNNLTKLQGVNNIMLYAYYTKRRSDSTEIRGKRNGPKGIFGDPEQRN